MSDEIVNNETENTDNQNTENQTEQNTPAVETPVETPAEEPTVYTFIRQELKLRTIYLNQEARTALSLEASEQTRQIAAKQIERGSLIAQRDALIAAKDAEIEILNQSVRTKTDRACSGSYDEQVMCDVYNTANDSVAVPVGTDPAVASNIVTRGERIVEPQEVVSE